MKDDPPLVPPPPLVWELLDRLGEIIAERPPQPLAGAIDYGGGNGPLGEIIAERVAGLPFEYCIAVAQLTILEILITRPDVPLTGLVRRHVALKLAEEWLPPWALKEIYRQRELTIVESTLELAKLGRTKAAKAAWAKAGKPIPKAFKKTPLEIVVADRGFQSVDALKQFLKRERPVRKKPRP